MGQNKSKMSFILKIGAGLVILFLVLVAVTDWTPRSETIEKTVVYGAQ